MAMDYLHIHRGYKNITKNSSNKSFVKDYSEQRQRILLITVRYIFLPLDNYITYLILFLWKNGYKLYAFRKIIISR